MTPKNLVDPIRRRISAEKDLRTLVEVFAKVLELTRDPESGKIGDLEGVIESDPALSSRILTNINSSYQGVSGRVASIRTAIVLLGYREIRRIAVSISALRVFESSSKRSAFNRRGLWRHSAACAHGARLAIERYLPGTDRRRSELHDVAYSAGLLHDIGKIFLSTQFEERFLAAIERAAQDAISLQEAEAREYGTDHAEVGAWLAEEWHLPDDLRQAIANHHGFELDFAKRPIDSAVRISNFVCHRNDFGLSGQNASWQATRSMASVSPEVESSIATGVREAMETEHPTVDGRRS